MQVLPLGLKVVLLRTVCPTRCLSNVLGPDAHGLVCCQPPTVRILSTSNSDTVPFLQYSPNGGPETDCTTE